MTEAPKFWITAKPSTVRKFLPDCEVETFYSEAQMLEFATRVAKRCKTEGVTVGVIMGITMAISVQCGFLLWGAP